MSITICWNNTIWCSILLRNYSIDRHDSYKHCKPAGGIEWIRNNMPSHSYLRVNGCVTIIHSDGWSLNILADSSLLQFSRQNFRRQLRLFRHRNDYCLICCYFRFKIESASFDFALHLQFIINTVNHFLYSAKEPELTSMEKTVI